MRWLTALIAMMALAVPSTVQAMTVAQFLAKAKALQMQGALAIISPDAELLLRKPQGFEHKEVSVTMITTVAA